MSVLEEDIQYLTNQARRLGLEGKSFVVTGATGMIGRILINVLRQITEDRNIYALGKDVKEVNSIFPNSDVNKIDFLHLNDISRTIDYVIHLASPTNSQFLKKKPVETISFIFESTKQVLDFALNHNAKVLYISSMEVFGEVFDEEKKGETDLGYLSLTNPRNSYPEAKRLCELLCHSYAKEYDLDVCSVRLAQTFGAGTIQNDPRVFGYFARCVLNGEDIVLGTKGDSHGNYCYVADTICAFFYVLANGIKGETYNVVGDNCRSTILDLANLIAKELGQNQIKVKIELAKDGIYPNPTKLNMDNNKLKSIGWIPKYGLLDMFKRMIDSWKDS